MIEQLGLFQFLAFCNAYASRLQACEVSNEKARWRFAMYDRCDRPCIHRVVSDRTYIRIAIAMQVRLIMKASQYTGAYDASYEYVYDIRSVCDCKYTMANTRTQQRDAYDADGADSSSCSSSCCICLGCLLNALCLSVADEERREGISLDH